MTVWHAPAQVLKLKTHCVRGHEFTPENIYRKDDGWRRCRECRKEYCKRRRQEAKSAA